MRTLDTLVSYLDFILCIEKALLDWFLGPPSSRNVKDRLMGVQLKVRGSWEDGYMNPGKMQPEVR